MNYQPYVLPETLKCPPKELAAGETPARPTDQARQAMSSELRAVSGRSWEIDESIASNIGFESVLNFANGSRKRVFLFDVVAASPTVEVDTDDPNLAWVYGIGYRICLAAVENKFSTGLSISKIAANATLNAVDSFMDSYGIALLTRTDTAITAALKGVGFDTSLYAAISQVCALVQEDLGSRLGETTIGPIGQVFLPRVRSYSYLNGVSSIYGIHCVSRGWNYHSSVNRLSAKLRAGKGDEYDYGSVAVPLNRTAYCALLGKPTGFNPGNTAIPGDVKKRADKLYKECAPKK